MTPSRFQVPVGVTRVLPASVNVRGAPPAISIRLSLLSAKNASDRLSGDHVGKFAPSVPGNARAVTESTGRSHKEGGPDFPRAANTTDFPSGEAASAPYSNVKTESGGGPIRNVTPCNSGGVSRK